MKNSSKNNKALVLLAFMLCLPMFFQVALAGSLPPGPPVTPPGVPIDGGLTLLLAGLGAYGAKKLFKKEEN